MNRWGGNLNPKFEPHETDESSGISPPRKEKHNDIENIVPPLAHKSLLDKSELFTVKYISQFSPRSKQAIKCLGIVPKDIIYVDRNHFLSNLEEGEIEELADMRFNHFEKRRQHLISDLRRQRHHTEMPRFHSTNALKRSATVDSLRSMRSVRSVRTGRSTVSQLEEEYPELVSAICEEDSKIAFQQRERQKKEIEQIVLNEINNFNKKKQKQKTIERENKAQKKRQLELKEKMELIKRNREQKMLKAKQNRLDKLRRQDEKVKRKAIMSAQRERQAGFFQERIAKQEKRACDLRKKIMNQFEMNLRSIELNPCSLKEKQKLLKQVEINLQRDREEIRTEINRLEESLKQENDRLKKKILNDQIVRWKEFLKQRDWMRKKFSKALHRSEKRDQAYRSISERNRRVDKIVEEEIKSKSRKVREQEKIRRELVEQNLRKLEEQREMKEHEYQLKLKEEHKRDEEKMKEEKRKRIERQKVLCRRAEEQKQAKIKKMRHIEHSRKKSQINREFMENKNKAKSMESKRYAMLEAERRILKQEDKYEKIRRMQRKEQYQKQQTLMKNKLKMQRSQALTEYKNFVVSKRKELHRDHLRRKKKLGNEISKHKRSDVLAHADNQALVNILKLGFEHLDDSGSFLSKLENMGIGNEVLHELVDKNTGRLKHSRSAGRL